MHLRQEMKVATTQTSKCNDNERHVQWKRSIQQREQEGMHQE